jgi:hypothetical protein
VLEVIPQATRFAATDLLHRRILLPFRFQCAYRNSAVTIETNSELIGDAIRRLECAVDDKGLAVSGRWEITVEALRAGCEFQPGDHTGGGFETFCFGSSRSLRIGDGSWFAHPSPSIDGVGFVMVSGDECHQLRQLILYLREALAFLFHHSDDLPLTSKGEDAK